MGNHPTSGSTIATHPSYRKTYTGHPTPTSSGSTPNTHSSSCPPTSPSSSSTTCSPTSVIENQPPGHSQCGTKPPIPTLTPIVAAKPGVECGSIDIPDATHVIYALNLVPSPAGNYLEAPGIQEVVANPQTGYKIYGPSHWYLKVVACPVSSNTKTTGSATETAIVVAHTSNIPPSALANTGVVLDPILTSVLAIAVVGGGIAVQLSGMRKRLFAMGRGRGKYQS